MNHDQSDHKRYFEDIDVGEKRSFGHHAVRKEDIKRFAKEFDPQPIHLDEEAAKRSIMNGIVASGWHTASMCMRLLVDNMGDRALAGARGIDRLRWITPVRPGDRLSVETEVIDKNPADSAKPYGYVDERLIGFNQRDERVISWIAHTMVYRRDRKREKP